MHFCEIEEVEFKITFRKNKKFPTPPLWENLQPGSASRDDTMNAFNSIVFGNGLTSRSKIQISFYSPAS
jgi:hypothetical protein